jgi:transcriptional regulator with XRE-family HTH domain
MGCSLHSRIGNNAIQSAQMGSQGVVAVPVWTGRESGQLRAALRMSQREYAAFLGASPRTVAGWESKGEAAVISADMQAVLDTALDRADHAIQGRFAAFQAGDHATPAAGKRSQASAAADGLPPQMPGDYRDLIRSAYATPKPARVPLSETDVSVVRGMLDSLTAADHQFGGGFARRTADSFLLEVIRPRLAAPGAGSVPRVFKAVAAELQIRVAWMHLDVADQGAARAAARDAFRLAQESEDLTVCSWVMAMSALLETWLGNTAAACAFGQAAVGLAAGSPRLVRAFAQGKLARALAAAGDSSGTLAALSQARSLFEAARPHEDERIPAAIRDGGYSAAYILDEEAHCFRDLGKDNRALTLSEQCLSLRGTDHFPRNRAFATGNLALALARLGEVDQACDSALSLLHLAATLQSSRVARRLDAVLDELMPFRGARPVTDLIEQVNETGVTRLRR